MMKETRWHYYTEGGERYRVKAQYGIDYAFARQHRQTEDFSVTGTIERKARNNRWYDHSGGQVTREIAAYIPEIAPYLKWHLVGPDGPMHYLANAKYWFEMAQGKEPKGKFDSDPVASFKRTIKLWAFPGDEVPQEIEYELLVAAKIQQPRFKGPKEWSPAHGSREWLPWSFVQTWLEERLPRLQAAWVVDMGELGVLEE